MHPRSMGFYGTAEAAPPRSIMEGRGFLSVESLFEAVFPQRQNVFRAFLLKPTLLQGRGQPAPLAAWGSGCSISWLLFIFSICVFLKIAGAKSYIVATEVGAAGSSFCIIEVSRH